MSARALALAGLVGLAACADDDLRQLKPRISICLAPDARAADCTPTLDLGEIAVGIDVERPLYVVNRGDGALAVSAATIDDPEIEVGEPPARVAPGSGEPLPLTFRLTGAFGPRDAALTVASDDPEQPTVIVQLVYEAVDAPKPRAVWCDGDDDDATCARELDLPITARPTQAEAFVAYLRNDGDAPLAVDDVVLDGDEEIAIESSSAEGTIAPGRSAGFLIVYRPDDAEGPDVADVLVDANDPADPPARLHVVGTTEPNLPPTAVAVESIAQASSTVVRVDQLVGLVGGGSSDPEGDPLVYRWSLEVPAGSAAAFDDPNAENALFLPDVRGEYRAVLVVEDSLGQQSAPAVVVLDAASRFRFRARVSWETGGDLDVHLVEAGSAPFSSRDAYFDNRVVGAGDPASGVDDARLLDDAIIGPGRESAAIEAPAAGVWEVWVHLFDDRGLGAADARVEIVIDDAATPVATVSRALGTTCDLWHAADVSLPDGVVTVVDAAPIAQCE